MSNFTKTIRYFKRNGFVSTCYAILERFLPQRGVPFRADEDSFSCELYRGNDISFSILVPVYETKPEYLKAMIDSCLMQTYGKLELIIADASKSDRPGHIIASYDDDRVRYIRLSENKGISANTNEALAEATGDYCVLLDHDDILNLNALSINASCIAKARGQGISPVLLYSDEDKCNEAGTKFFGAHYKEKFNLDLLLSNNYICHLAVIRRDVLQKTRFRPEFDGSQDHDLFLRIAGEAKDEEIIHIPEILYHWRCSSNSTAEDPASKEYAYKAGLKAVGEFASKHFGKCHAEHLEHRGFYRVVYEEDIFTCRPEVGAVGGMAVRRHKVVTGVMNEQAKDPYAGMPVGFSGYMKKAKLQQQVYALDIRTVRPSPEMKEAYDKLHAEFIESCHKSDGTKKTINALAAREGFKFGKECAARGKKIIFMPEYNGEV